MTQVNTYYPSTTYLTGYLRAQGHDVIQRDFSLALFLKIFSRAGLTKIFSTLPKKPKSEIGRFVIESPQDYLNTIESVIRFLQGKDSSLAIRIANRKLVPEGPRFLPLAEHENLLSVFGELGIQDKAKYIASLYLDDLADLIKLEIDPRFELSRYGEKLSESEPNFGRILEELEEKPTVIDEMLNELIHVELTANPVDLVGLSIPFAGNVYAAFRIAKYIKTHHQHIKLALGGGFVNTELRDLTDARIFDFFDFLTFDDGEKPLELIIESLSKPDTKLMRTYTCENQKIIKHTTTQSDIAFRERPAPLLEGLNLNDYVAMLELPNQMHRLWSDFRWNKLMLAHGCYWRRCTFCDINLDYIGRFEPAKVDNLIAHMQSLAEQSGQTGFHFVDEAAPPALLKALSEELIKRGLQYTWWGNLRFDKQFTPELAQLMADAGCVAVTGGLEVASPRLLKLIDKGISIEQVAKVTKAFVEAGIYVHAYLMYGFPSQTTQETVDSLEVVRQLFIKGTLHSAHWHRFLATAHSPVGREPQKFGVSLKPLKTPREGLFARYEVPFEDEVETDHDRLGEGLRRALYNYMHGVGLKKDVREWFNIKQLPRPAKIEL